MVEPLLYMLGGLFNGWLPESRAGQWVLLALCAVAFVATIVIVVLALTGEL